jgi:predicted enzyme related to lactoylglutathione lyase
MTTTENTIDTTSSLGYIPELTCSVSVRNLEQAKTWYQNVLGFKHLYTMPEIAWAELSTAIPGVNVGLSEVEHFEPGGSVVLVFGVKDIVQARAQLEARHVRFDGPINTVEGMVKLATFYDMDGNPFMLSETIPSKN